MSKQVFVSYSTQDTAAAEQVRNGLESAGIPCWMAPRDIVPGQDYAEQIIDAIEGCDSMVLVVSESSNISRFVRNEVERAVSKDKTIIPVRIHNVTLSRSLEFFISSAQWIDVLEGVGGAVSALVAAIDSRRDLPVQRIHEGDPGIGEQSKFRHNLPTPATPFVGRERELGEVASLLARADVRLVTILGPGGMGKTRLGLEVARSYGQAQGQRVVYVELAPLSDPADMVTAMADALGFTFEPNRGAPRQQLVEILHDQFLLLVLDNFEHLLAGVDLVSEILQAAPGVRVLATSRERLQLSSERLFLLGGMEFPEWETPEDAAEYTAVKLFLQSARQVRGDYELRADNLPFMARICRLVQGVPLAILLAAGWVDMLSTEEIAAEIAKSVDFLETELRDLPERQRSIRAVFDYSWRLLSERERDAFARLSVFRGGMTREAAEAVAGAGLRTLAALHNKSLLTRTEGGRYEIHELLLQYGAEELQKSGAMAEVQASHGAYYLNLLREREADIKGRDQVKGLRELEADFENIRVAWRWAVRERNHEGIERAMEGLYWFCCIGHHIQDGQPLFDLARDAWAPTQEEDTDTEERTRFWARLQACILEDRDYPRQTNAETLARLHESLAVVRSHGKPWDLGFVLWRLGRAYEHREFHFSGWLGVRQALEQAVMHGEESLSIYQTLGDPFYQANCAGLLSSCYAKLGQREKAYQSIEEGLALSRAIGDLDATAYFLARKRYWCLDRSIEKRDQVEALGDEELSIRQQLGDPKGIASAIAAGGIYPLYYDGGIEQTAAQAQAVLHVARAELFPDLAGRAQYLLGLVAFYREDYGTAEALFNQAADSGFPSNIFFSSIGLAMTYCGLHDYARAKPIMQGWSNRVLPPLRWLSMTLFGVMAILLAHEGRKEQAAELLSLVVNHPDTPKGRGWFADWPQLKRLHIELETQLDPERFSRAWERGKRLQAEEVFEALKREVEWLRPQPGELGTDRLPGLPANHGSNAFLP